MKTGLNVKKKTTRYEMVMNFPPPFDMSYQDHTLNTRLYPFLRQFIIIFLIFKIHLLAMFTEVAIYIDI
jgi:hypothetical protein